MSGLPCSSKTTLARLLAPTLGLPVIDKDDILEELFESQGVGDTAWRRKLSRESDALFESRAKESAGAILVSFWHVAGMAADSGTPAEWLAGLAGGIVEVHCSCSPEIAAERFVRRQRHPGHLDAAASYDAVLRSMRAIPRCGMLDIGRRVTVDTSATVDLQLLLDQLQSI